MSDKPWMERVLVRTGNGVSNKTELFVYVPYEGSSNKPWLKEVLGRRVRPQPVTRNGYKMWKLSSKHMLPLAAALADRYGEVELRMEFSKTMRCDTNCQDADPYSVWRCVCKCGGENHGGVARYADWYRSGRSTLIRHEFTDERHVVIQRGQLRLHEATSHPEPEPEPAAPSSHPPQPLRQPNPAPRPAPEPSARREIRTPPPMPHNIVPGPQPVSDLGRDPAAANSRGSGPDLRVVPSAAPQPKRGRTGPLVAAATVTATISVALWLLVPANRQDKPEEASPRETVQQAPAQPEPPAAEEPAPPIETPPPPVPTPRRGGCYPFQQNC